MIDKTRDRDTMVSWVHNGTVGAKFMHSVVDALLNDSRHPRQRICMVQDAGGPYIHDNRCRIARQFLERTDLQWLWMLDTDVGFPADSLDRLLAAAEEHDTKILGGAYWNEYDGTQTRLTWLNMYPKIGMVAIDAEQFDTFPKTGEPVEVTACGMGCTLIHRDALQDVAASHVLDPWATFGADMLLRFEDGTMLLGQSPMAIKEQQRELGWEKKDMIEDDHNPSRCGEDVTFCLRARREGYRPHGLPTLMLEHIKANPVRPDRRDPVLWTPDKAAA